MGIYANFDIIHSFQRGVGSVDTARKPQHSVLKSLDALKDPTGRLARDSQSMFAMQKIVSMHKAVEAIRTSSREEQVIAARIASANDLDLGGTESFTTLASTEEVNATTSPGIVSDPVRVGSTAQVVVGGAYDGSNGSGRLTVEVMQGGIHGEDDLQLRLFDENDNTIRTITVSPGDDPGQSYGLGNGLSLTLGEGQVLTGDRFSIDVTAGVNIYSEPTSMTASSAQATLSGIYDGSDGSGRLTFEVVSGGTRGVDTLQLQMYDANNNPAQTITLHKNHALDTQYDLGNGLKLSLGSGEILTGDRFGVAVAIGESSYSDPTALSESTAQAAITGSYDGSDGNGQLTFEVVQGGIHGQDDLQIQVYDAANNPTRTISVRRTDALGKEYDLGNGLSFALGAGEILTGDRFTLEVSATDASVSTPTGWSQSTAAATIGGEYNGSTGDGTLTFEVISGGTHGKDHLKVRMYDTAGNSVEDVFIKKTDALNKEYTLSNGLSMTLGSGNLVAGDTFTVDVTSAQSATSAPAPWTGAGAEFAVGGTYDGSTGSGTLTFEVVQGGTHGTDDLSVQVYDADNNAIDTIAIGGTDAIGREYALSNGLTLSLSEGNILTGSRFTVDVVTAEDSYTAPDPWTGASAEFTVGGTYDGSTGSGTLTFEVVQGGTHGTDDLSVQVYDADNNAIDTIAIGGTDAIGREYALSNGLTLSLSEGTILTGARFGVDVTAGANSASGPSTWSSDGATMSVSGAYDGSGGDDTFTFMVSQGGVRGVDDIRVDMYDSAGNQIATIDVGAQDSADQSYALSNGLTVTFSEGAFVTDTVFNVAVTAPTDNAVDPDKALNGTGADGANLETGYTVGNGAFQINGVEIAVNSGDSINDVLDRISQSGAGVTAAFDAEAEKVVVTQNTGGPGHEIVFENDTSGFLAAVKIDGAAATPGEITGGVNAAIAEVASLSGVQSGTFTINGVDIAVDVANDSVQEVIDRINASGTGVTAGVDLSNDRITLTGNTTDPIVLDSGDTNFFASVGMAEGMHAPTVQRAANAVYLGSALQALSEATSFKGIGGGSRSGGSDGEQSGDAEMIATMVNMTANSMNSLFDDANFNAAPNRSVKQARSEIRSAIASAFGSDGPAYKSGVGIDFDFGEQDNNVASVDQERLGSVLTAKGGAASVRDALFGSGAKGLLAHLDEGLNRALANLQSNLGSSSGVFLDISA